MWVLQLLDMALQSLVLHPSSVSTEPSSPLCALYWPLQISPPHRLYASVVESLAEGQHRVNCGGRTLRSNSEACHFPREGRQVWPDSCNGNQFYLPVRNAEF